jgi:iron(III) transport system permease protein
LKLPAAQVGAPVGARRATWPLDRLPRVSPLWLLVIPVVATVLGLLATVFWLSFLQGQPGTPDAYFTLENYVKLYADPFVLTALTNTLGFGLTSVCVGLAFGLAIAWLVERTSLPAKPLIYTLMTLGLLIPSFFLAMGWLFLLHPRIGLINQWIMALTGVTEAPFNVQTVVGMGWVHGLSMAPLAFILTSASFRAMDPALEEAALVNGASFPQMLRRVFLPLAFPGILSAVLYIFTITLASFDVPAILGLSNRVFTFSTFVYFKKAGAGDAFPDYGPTAAMSVLMVVVAIALSSWYGNVIKKAEQYQVVTGKGYRPHQIELGGWALAAWAFVALYFLLSKILPLLLLLWAAGLPFFQQVSVAALGRLSFQNFANIPFDMVARGASNTAILMLVVPTLTLLVSFGFSWLIVRARSRLSGALDFFAFLPHAVPEIIFGVGALFVALFLLKGVPLYGSLALFVIVYVVVRLSFGTRLLNSTLIQIHRELVEAAAISGAGGLHIARRVLAPLVWPALVNGWLWIALLTYRELTLASVLYSRDTLTLSLVVWTLWNAGKDGIAAAISVLLLACLAPLALLYFAVSRRHLPGGGLAR